MHPIFAFLVGVNIVVYFSWLTFFSSLFWQALVESIEKTSPKVSYFLAVCCEVCLEYTWTQWLIKYLCCVSCSKSKLASSFNKICLFANFQLSTCFKWCFLEWCMIWITVFTGLQCICLSCGEYWEALNYILPQKIHQYHYLKTIAKYHNTSLRCRNSMSHQNQVS